MDPIFLKIGVLEIRYYGLLMALAFLVGYFIARRISHEFDIKKDDVDSFLVYIIIAMLAGARLFHVFVYEPAYYLANPLKIFYIWEGGLASHGAMIAIIITGLIFCKKRKIHFYNLADLLVIPIALGASFVRIGNFINGELVGKITTLPWAVKFEGYEGLRHPSQLYQAIADFILFLILFNVRKLKSLRAGKGNIFWLFLLLYSVFRFFTEFYKDFQPHYFGLDLPQYFSLVIIIVSLVFLFKSKLKTSG